MPRTRPRPLWCALIVAAGAVRPLSWIIAEWRHCAAGVCAVSGSPPQWDFTLFWEAGRLALARDYAAIFLFPNFQHVLALTLHYNPGPSPFAYPPPALLVLAPLALLPLPLAYGLWVAAGTLLLVLALRGAGLNWLSCGLVLASPPFLYNLLLGQNGAFVAAALIAALAQLARRPRLAGGLAAWLLVKPQMALLLPAVLLGAGKARAIIAACGAGLLILALSLLAFGALPWWLYLQATLPEMRAIMDLPFPQGFQASAITLFMLARSAHLPIPAALAVQAMAFLVCCYLTFRVWRTNRDFAEQLFITVCLGLLAMPYGYVYDMIGYAAGLALIAQRRGPSFTWAMLWIWPAAARDVTVAFLQPITPLIVLMALLWASSARRARTANTVMP